MAMRPPRPCKHPGCAALTREGWCEKHKPEPRPTKRGVSAAYHGWYSKPIWVKRLRPDQLSREPFCRVCAGRGIRTRATVVDHIEAFRGNWDLFVSPTNHQSLCKYHHDQKTAREQAQNRTETRH